MFTDQFDRPCIAGDPGSEPVGRMGLDHDAVAGPVATDPLMPTVVGVLGDGLPQAVGEAIPVRGRWMVGATEEMRE